MCKRAVAIAFDCCQRVLTQRFFSLAVCAISTIALAPNPVSAAALINVTGPTFDDIGLGVDTNGQQSGVVQFTTTGFTGGTISVTLDGVGSAQTITAWITNAIGAGTTVSNVLNSTTFSGPASANGVVESVFTGLTLGAGTYYLTLSALGQSNSTGWVTSLDFDSMVTQAPGNTYDGSSACASGFGNNNNFPPSYLFGKAPFDFAFSITGTPVAQTPLPGALPLFATGLGALGLLGWRRKRKAKTF